MYLPLTQTVSQASIWPVFPKAVDPVVLRQARVVPPWVAHGGPDGVAHLVHSSGLGPVQSGRLHGPVGGDGPAEEGGVVASSAVGGAELRLRLLLLLLLVGQARVLAWAHPEGQSGDRVLRGEHSPAGRMRREGWVGWCQVIVEGSLGG